MFYELASSSWGDEEIQAIQRVIASGRYTMGENALRFEEAFVRKFGMQHAIMVSPDFTAHVRFARTAERVMRRHSSRLYCMQTRGK